MAAVNYMKKGTNTCIKNESGCLTWRGCSAAVLPTTTPNLSPTIKAPNCGSNDNSESGCNWTSGCMFSGGKCIAKPVVPTIKVTATPTPIVNPLKCSPACPSNSSCTYNGFSGNYSCITKVPTTGAGATGICDNSKCFGTSSCYQGKCTGPDDVCLQKYGNNCSAGKNADGKVVCYCPDPVSTVDHFGYFIQYNFPDGYTPKPNYVAPTVSKKVSNPDSTGGYGTGGQTGPACSSNANPPAEVCTSSRLSVAPLCLSGHWDYDVQLCIVKNRVETCGGQNYCCPAVNGSWTTDMSKCPGAVTTTGCSTKYYFSTTSNSCVQTASKYNATLNDCSNLTTTCAANLAAYAPNSTGVCYNSLTECQNAGGGSTSGTPILNYKVAFGGVKPSSSQCVVDWPLQFIVLSGGESKVYSDVIPSTKTDMGSYLQFSGSLVLTGFTKTNNVAVFIKGPKHLQMKYGINNQTESYNQAGGQITLATTAAASPIYDFTGYPIIPGDVVGVDSEDQDGWVNGVDFSFVKSKSLVHETVTEGGYLKGDLDGNCQVNSNDVNLLKISLQEKQGQLY